MRSGPPARRLFAASALIWLTISSAAAAREATGGLLLARPRAEAELADVARGYAAWLHDKLVRSGFAVAVPDRNQDAGASHAEAIGGLRELARRSGASVLVVPELQLHAGTLSVRLLLEAVATGALLAAPQASAPLAAPGSACEDTLLRLFERLEVPANAIPATTPPQLDELAASGRAIGYLEVGDLARAWREVEGRLSATALALRESITAQAQRPETPFVERARVLAISGDGDGAWALLAAEMTRGLAEPHPDARLLLAAAQAQLARGDPRAARPYLDALLARQPDDAELQLELGRLLLLQNDREGARTALTRSAELDTASPRPLALLAEIDADDPPRQALHLLAAGRRETARLNPQRAERHFERAIELDPAAEKATLLAIGSLNQRIGLPAEALAAFDAAREAGDADAEVFTGMGVAQRRMRQKSAEASLRRALALEPERPEALRELGELYAESGRPAEAAGLLERAVALEPRRAESRRALAQVLHASGDTPRALALLTGKDAPEADSAATLGAAATLHREQGNLPAARAELLRAVELAPHDGALRLDLAAVAEAQGDADAAREARAFAKALDGAPLNPDETPDTTGPSLDELVASFAVQTLDPRKRRVALLGIREPASWRLRALDWLEPTLPDLSALETSLVTALGENFRLEPGRASESPALGAAIDDLYAFESERSVSASAIANVIAAVGTDAVFVARLVRHPAPIANPAEVAPSCADPEHLEIELRMLSGGYKELSSILVDVECLSSGAGVQRAWNARAIGVYAALAMLLCFPVVRGWGTIVVAIKLPPRTKGFLRIRISTKPEKVRDAEQEKRERKRAAGRLARSLSSFSRYVKHMVGRETIFRWIPARKREYVVTVRGPLQDAMSDEMIGHFLEEQRVRVIRGQSVKVSYDFCPEDCAVEIIAVQAGEPARGARVAVRGDPKSLRYAREGSAFLYLRPGAHTLLVGHQDRACERRLEIEPSKKALRLTIELGNDEDLAFLGCAAAVDPFLQGDLVSAAQLLETAGQAEKAALLRASFHQQRGEHQRAASEFEAAGRLEEAAEMYAAGSGFVQSAQLFERAGNFVRAAETFRASGDPLAAARCYETAYDYDSALECYEEAGAADRVIDLLEKTGAYLDAARRAHREGESDRAVRNLQLIERRDTVYGEACALMSELLAARGEADLAASKLAEAIEEAGGEAAPAPLHERHAALLEQAGQRQQALVAYQTLRRRDPARSDVTQRIASLQRELEVTQAAGDAATRTADSSAESRYEIQGELGRGGMGVVFKARDKRLGRIVALKRLPENLRQHKVAVELFLREAQAAAVLNHRNIVTVYDAGEENGVYFITMELLDGLPLNAILEKRGRLSTPDTARLGLQIAAGLQYAHDNRIVHRDIKTANLFFTRDRVVKIMDFGLAKTIEEVRRSSTMIGGTPFYMAPEQAAGDAVDHRTDLYAFGVTLFRMVTGAMPFAEGDLAYHHRHTPAPDPREIDASIPSEMAELLAKLLAKQPSDRCQSAAEVAASLQSLLPPR